jgi:PAS domain S-box-containing protein
MRSSPNSAWSLDSPPLVSDRESVETPASASSGRLRFGVGLALRGALLCAAYYAGTAVGYAVILPGSYVSVVWPPNTVLLVALLLSPTRRWPWILSIGLPVHLAAHANHGASASTSAIYYGFNCVIVLTTAAALRRCRIDRLPLESLQQTLRFLGVTTVAVGIATLIWSLLIVSLWQGFPRSSHSVWVAVFLSNYLPFLVMTPALVIGATRRPSVRRVLAGPRVVEVAALGVGLAICGTLLFSIEPSSVRSLPAFFCVPVPLLLWAAVRFGPAGLSGAFTVFAGMAVTTALGSNGTFVGEPTEESVLWLQLFLLALYVPMLVLAAVVGERRDKEAALRESEARYRGIVEDQSELICRLLPDGTYTFVNGAYARYFKTTPEALMGRSFWAFLPPEQRSRSREFLDSIRVDRPVATIEHEVLLPDGEVRWQQWTDRGFFDERGRVVEYQAVGRDVTALKRAEEEHRQLVAQKRVETALREADRRKDEFIAMLAHELRNPLAPVVSALEIVRGLDLHDETFQWARDVIGRQVAQLRRLVDDLLDLSRISRGSINVRMEPLDLRSAISQAVETSQPLMTARRHRFSTDIAPLPLAVRGDLVRLAQVVSNLLNNAAKYTDPGGTIRLSARRDGSEVVLSVLDNGAGIPPDMQERIFETFVQVEGTSDRAQGGLGIGLTLVERLVELHGGSVHAYSEGPGRGSEFVVRLPVDRALASATVANVRRAAGARPGLRILVVDDNVDSADAMVRLLEGQQHEVHVVNDGRSALSEAERVWPDVVLLDLALPGMDGLQVARELRRRGDASVLLVAMTGFGRDEDRRRTAEAGFDHHLVKPIDSSALGAVLAGSRRSA